VIFESLTDDIEAIKRHLGMDFLANDESAV
jgi:hypothetical protein